jgi:purine-binding chemotaxis protein CheW
MSSSTVERTQVQSLAGKYVTFLLGTESYGIPVHTVREIISIMEPTPVPQMPEYVKGIINLRGRIIPVVDLRLKLQLSKFETTARSCIMVVEIQSANRVKTTTGLIVDAVQDVLNFSSKDIEPTPDFGSSLSTEFILGVAHAKSRVTTLLNIAAVVSATVINKLADEGASKETE